MSRLIGEAFLWLAAGVGAAAITLFALFVESRSWSAHTLPFALLFTALAVLSCFLPVSAPFYSDRVRATPLVALAALLTLPPALSSLPVLLAGTVLIAFQSEHTTRRATLGQFALIVLSQLATAILLQASRLLPISQSDASLLHCLPALGGAITLFCALYLGGSLAAYSRQSPGPGSRRRPRGTGWCISLANEAAITLGGSVVAGGFAVILISDPTIGGATMAVGVIALFGAANRVLGERGTLRRQVQALEKLTARAMIDESASFTRLVNEFLHCCRPLLLFDRARVWVYDESEMLLNKACEHATGLAPSKGANRASGQPTVRRLGEDLVGRVAERSAPLIIRDIRRDPRHRFYRLSPEEKARLGPVSLLALPLVACGDVVGVVEFERNAWSAYTPSDRRRIQSLATLVAMGIANIAQHRNICRQAVTDGLTGLSNKRHILQVLAGEVRRAERYKHPLSVMMLDLDGFKAYNDTFGHLLGDVLLQQVGQLIQRSIRTTDSAGRYGGEEFLVILPETGNEGAAVIAERIRAQVAAARFPGAAYRASSPGALAQFVLSSGNAGEPEEGYTHKTISIGVATYLRESEDIQKLLALADDALYRAKRGGRNQVVIGNERESAEDSPVDDEAEVAA